MAKKMAKKNSGKSSRRIPRRGKVHPIYFAIAGAAFSSLILILSSGFSSDFWTLAFFYAVNVVNFFILGYSFRLKTPRSRKLVLWGSLFAIASLTLFYYLGIAGSVPLTISIMGGASAKAAPPSAAAMALGIIVSLASLAEYLLFLFGLKEVIRK